MKEESDVPLKTTNSGFDLPPLRRQSSSNEVADRDMSIVSYDPKPVVANAEMALALREQEEKDTELLKPQE